MTTILLARHGQASFGQEDYDQLSELGSMQAQMLGQHYATTQRRIDAIFSGSLVRQQDSARHFWQSYQSSFGESNEKPSEFNHKDVLLKSNPAFASRVGIAAEIAKAEVPVTRLAELFDDAMQRWHAGENDSDYIESWLQFNERAKQALEQVRQQVANLQLGVDSTVLVFTSGGIIAAITAQLLQQGSSTAYQINKSLVNTGVKKLLKNIIKRLL